MGCAGTRGMCHSVGVKNSRQRQSTRPGILKTAVPRSNGVSLVLWRCDRRAPRDHCSHHRVPLDWPRPTDRALGCKVRPWRATERRLHRSSTPLAWRTTARINVASKVPASPGRFRRAGHCHVAPRDRATQPDPPTHSTASLYALPPTGIDLLQQRQGPPVATPHRTRRSAKGVRQNKARERLPPLRWQGPPVARPRGKALPSKGRRHAGGRGELRQGHVLAREWSGRSAGGPQAGVALGREDEQPESTTRQSAGKAGRAPSEGEALVSTPLPAPCAAPHGSRLPASLSGTTARGRRARSGGAASHGDRATGAVASPRPHCAVRSTPREADHGLSIRHHCAQKESPPEGSREPA